MYDEQFYKTLGKYADYAITAVPWYDPKSEMAHQVEAAFKGAVPQRPGSKAMPSTWASRSRRC